jgi:hypothetical protein
MAILGFYLCHYNVALSKSSFLSAADKGRKHRRFPSLDPIAQAEQITQALSSVRCSGVGPKQIS